MKRVVWEKWYDLFAEDEPGGYRDEPKEPTPEELMARHYNLWLGHTNFDITEPIAKKIEEVAGVETLEILTRYRFRLGIAKTFSESAVKRDIEQAIKPLTKEKDSDPELEELKIFLSKAWPCWAIIAMPDGTYQFATGLTRDEVEQKTIKHQGVARHVIYSEVEEEAKDCVEKCD